MKRIVTQIKAISSDPEKLKWSIAFSLLIQLAGILLYVAILQVFNETQSEWYRVKPFLVIGAELVVCKFIIGEKLETNPEKLITALAALTPLALVATQIINEPNHLKAIAVFAMLSWAVPAIRLIYIDLQKLEAEKSDSSSNP